MFSTRVIPCLLLKGNGFYKTIKFKNPVYLGDPINIIKIFNDKMVDEICILDISATNENKGPNFSLLKSLASECFMPLGYGGGINNIEQIKELFYIGFEKIILNTAAIENPNIIKDASNLFGSQSIVVSIDVKKKFLGKYEVMIKSGKKKTAVDPVIIAKKMEKYGAGEIIINSIDRDGTMQGYDISLIKMVSESVKIPVIACGGAGKVADFKDAIEIGRASAVAAGSMFVFQGPHRAVLINYPSMIDILN
jgi:cyclase